MLQNTNNKIYSLIISNKNNNKKSIGILIDPDFATESHLKGLFQALPSDKIAFILVGGSLMTNGNVNKTIHIIKQISNLPIIIFPGSGLQIDDQAEAIFLLSLISGRNPDYLIGKHVESAHILKQSGLEIIPTGYMLIDGGQATTASYISFTNPIPHHKPNIAASTAMAGEMLGLKLIYLDAGSGAEKSVSIDMISAVANHCNLPIIVGGGIKTINQIEQAHQAGADMVIIGNVLESNINFFNS